jgi:hypothetical protein
LNAVVTGYADDTSLLYSYRTKEELETTANHALQILQNWFRNNLLHLNLNKSFVLHGYKTPNWASQISLHIEQGKTLEKVDAVKYLGLWLDEKLNGKKHSFYVQAKLRKANYLYSIACILSHEKLF